MQKQVGLGVCAATALLVVGACTSAVPSQTVPSPTVSSSSVSSHPTSLSTAAPVSSAPTVAVAGTAGAPSSSATGRAGPARPLRATGVETLRCGNPIDGMTPPPTWQTVLGVVGLATSPRAAAAQTSLTGDPDPSRRLFAKMGLVVRAGIRFRLIVPTDAPGGLGIGWGDSATPHRGVIIVNCPDLEHTGWLSYPGGFWINRPACVSLTVQVGRRTQRVRFGLGVACPGQKPPEGPTYT